MGSIFFFTAWWPDLPTSRRAGIFGPVPPCILVVFFLEPSRKPILSGCGTELRLYPDFCTNLAQNFANFIRIKRYLRPNFQNFIRTTLPDSIKVMSSDVHVGLSIILLSKRSTLNAEVACSRRLQVHLEQTCQ